MSLSELLFTTVHAVSQTLKLDTVLTDYRYRSLVLNVTIACVVISVLLRWHRTSRQKVRTTELRGPPSESFFYGVGKRILDAEDAGFIYETWAQEYGPIYAVPSTLGNKRIILCDPKAIAHFHAKETWTYIQTPFNKMFIALFFGKGLVWSHGEEHRRQRKSLTPAFSIGAIRHLTPVFYNSAYKAKAAWDTLIESSGGDNSLIDIQIWMNHISLDTIGLAGFSHDFGALEGKHDDVTELFDEFGGSPKSKTGPKANVELMGLVFPFLARAPTQRLKLILKLNLAMGEISNVLLARTKKEMEMGVAAGKEEKSVIGLLIKGEKGKSDFSLTKEEVMAQMRVLLLAGYETTSITLTWALLELARNPKIQTRLRNELLEHGADPTYDQLSNGLPYLDAIVHEILRVHPPVTEFTRVAAKDDVVPLSEPIRTKSGKLVNSLTIAKGTLLAISIEAMNRSIALWGEDAKHFRPSRWLETSSAGGIPDRAKKMQGHRHLLTFWDGPKMCLGKNFALTEFKAVMVVLVKSFVFEMRDGVDAKIEIGRGMLPRPILAGEQGCKMPLRVRPYLA